MSEQRFTAVLEGTEAAGTWTYVDLSLPSRCLRPPFTRQGQDRVANNSLTAS